ncbi:MAG: flagellar brake protein [Acidimicrobiales bacterium]
MSEGDMSSEAPETVRRLPWAPEHLVEGSEALLWPAPIGTASSDGLPPRLPDPSEAWPAVLSWARSKVVRFELLPPPRPVPELVLASTASAGGPVRFVVAKSYQVGGTVACEPPEELFLVERRDLFRVPLAARVTVESPAGSWASYCVDFSLGGLRVPVPCSLEVGSEVRLQVELGANGTVVVDGSVRHCHSTCGQAVLGVQFVGLDPRTEQRLSYLVGSHQRRLLPRVKAAVPVDYGPEGGKRRGEALASELSPGDVSFVARDAYALGERLGLQLRVSRQEFSFGATVLRSELVPDSEDDRCRLVCALLDEVSGEVQAQFRRAVRELALERTGANPRL